jgi:hypothetical protein
MKQTLKYGFVFLFLCFLLIGEKCNEENEKTPTPAHSPPKHTLTVEVSPGLWGYPESGTYEYTSSETVEYEYSL